MGADAILPGPYRKRIEEAIHARTAQIIKEALPTLSPFEWEVVCGSDPLTVLYFIDLCGDHIRPHVNDALSLFCRKGINTDWMRYAGPTHCAYCDSMGQLYARHPEFHQAAKYCLILQFPLTRDVHVIMGQLLRQMSFK
jgi:hypothetical protein